jgi:class 3 adenylate cyclase
MVEALEAGRTAMVSHAWIEAMDGFEAADRDGGLEPADLERWGAAAWWSAHPDRSTEVLERAFAGFLAAGKTEDATRVAITLGYQAFRRQAPSIGAGWLARTERLLESLPSSPLHADLAVFQAIGAALSGEVAAALELADAALASAREHHNDNAAFMAMSVKGLTQVMSGEWREGMALIDEAAAAAASGLLGLRAATDIYCITISACRNVGDLERAGQWADEGERWMRGQGVAGYPGICRVHRAELKRLRGHWAEAEQEALQASEELLRFGLLDAVGHAFNEVGEVRLRMGDIEAAGEAFERAYEYGHSAQPGTALVQLARGNVGEAARSIKRAVDTTGGDDGPADQSARAMLLPAQVDIAIAAKDLETARQAVDALEGIAASYQRPLFEAGALTGRGELLLGEARPSEASPILDRSWRLWQRTDLPYEAARARLRYAEAVAAEGDADTARRDLRAVRKTFERLGARLDLERVDALLGAAPGDDPPSTQRLSRTFMFTDIVTSTDLVGLIGDEAWGELLRWHDRELRAAVAGHRGEEVKHTGDGFFVAFEGLREALECAVDIQRRLARHRRDHGFAPKVRIGLHTSEASRVQRDFQGRGVHLAARVAAAAGAEEILVSDASLAGLPPMRFGLSEPRRLQLKGIDEPVDVRAVDWR